MTPSPEVEAGREWPHFLVFDVESVGLHGDGFAVGFVLIAPNGSEEGTGLAWCDPDGVRNGLPADREWVAANALPGLPASCRELGVREVRDFFWRSWVDAPEGTLLAADVAWPVEARFLTACIDDDPIRRNWRGPYPLVDIASVRLAAGFDPSATESREATELPAHNPLADARQSARLLLAALAALGSPREGGRA